MAFLKARPSLKGALVWPRQSLWPVWSPMDLSALASNRWLS